MGNFLWILENFCEKKDVCPFVIFMEKSCELRKSKVLRKKSQINLSKDSQKLSEKLLNRIQKGASKFRRNSSKILSISKENFGFNFLLTFHWKIVEI
jgi:hypothetical protein